MSRERSPGLRKMIQFIKKDYQPDGDTSMMVWDQVGTKLAPSRNRIKFMRNACDGSATDDAYGVEKPEQVQGEIYNSTFGRGNSCHDYPGETDQFPAAVLFDRKRQTIAGRYLQEIMNRWLIGHFGTSTL